MTLGSKKVKGRTMYFFELTEYEFMETLKGRSVKHITSNSKYEKITFILSAKGIKRK